MSKREQSSETSCESEEEDCTTTPTSDRALADSLRTAVEERDFEATKKAIGDGASIETVCGEGSVIFDWCMYGDINEIRYLLAQKADVNYTGDYNTTVLMRLYEERVPDPQKSKEEVDQDFLDTAQMLIDEGVDVNAWSCTYVGRDTMRGRNLLEMAAMKFQHSYCRLLINNKANINARSPSNYVGARICLHWACSAPEAGGEGIKWMGNLLYHEDVPCASTRSVDYVRFLIHNDADVDAQDYDGKTPLCLAAERGWFEAVRTLIETPLPKKLLERSKKISLILKFGSKWGIVESLAGEIVGFLVRVFADPSIDAKKPFRWKGEDVDSEENVDDEGDTSNDSDHEEQAYGGSNESEDGFVVAERDESFEDGTALGIARRLNHVDIVKYLSRLN